MKHLLFDTSEYLIDRLFSIGITHGDKYIAEGLDDLL